MKRFLKFFYGPQGIIGNSTVMWNAGGKAGTALSVPGVKPELPARLTNFGLGKACLDKGYFDAKLMNGLQPGPGILEVIEVGTIKKKRKIPIMHTGEKFLVHAQFAEVAAALAVTDKLLP
jgi:hypothetical protein